MNKVYSKGIFEKLKAHEKNILRNGLQALVEDLHWAKPREKKVLEKILRVFYTPTSK